jgi:pimeloyl-ACP methyl ester carboxylesterase
MAMTTHLLECPEVDLTYDVHGPLPTADGRPPLVMIGQPMDASGFAALTAQLPDRTVVTYDPRGLGRSTRKDGRVDHRPEVQAADVHAVITALGVGPVEMFASSGGAVTALALVAAHPDDVTTLVAHEPPLVTTLPDAAAAERAQAEVRDTYEAKGWGAGMAAFITMTSWRGEFTDAYSPSPRPIRPCSGCRPRTTARATTRCCPTGRGRSPATGSTSTRWPRRRAGWWSPSVRSPGA